MSFRPLLAKYAFFAILFSSGVSVAAGLECRSFFDQAQRLTSAAAIEIVLSNGAETAQSAYRNAMARVLRTGYQNTGVKIEEIRLLFATVQRLFPEWSFTESTLVSGEHMFVGNVGYALLVSPEGKIFRGMATRLGFDRFDNALFGPPFKDLVEVHPVP